MGKPLHQRVVPETYVQLLYEYLEARDYSPESVLGEPWPSSATQGIGGVDVELWQRMLERAETQLADPLIGLHLSQTITARHLGILGAVLMACENLGSVLLRLERYQRLIFDVQPMSRRAGPGWVELFWDASDYRAGYLVEQTGYAALITFARSIVRGAVNPLLVRLAAPAPRDIGPFEDLFGCPVLFNQPEPGLRFGLDLLASPLKSPDPAIIALLEQHADRLLEQLPQQEEIVEHVRKAIAHALREGEPDLEKISARLHCSSRTLRRRLLKAGTSFRAEANLVRHELAASYLRDPRLQIVDIALLLGYSEHSAFTRAFRESTGMTPLQMRQQQQSGHRT